MANRYWVGGTGAWDNSSTANWSTTSGGAPGASAPTVGDTAIFNASSGTGTVTCSFLSLQAQCSVLNITAAPAGLTFSGEVYILDNNTNFSLATAANISGLDLVISDVFGGTWSFTLTGANETINSLSVRSSSGHPIVTLTGGLTTNGGVLVDSNNTGNADLYISSGTYNIGTVLNVQGTSGGGNLTLGTSTINTPSIQITNLSSFNANTSTINLSSPGSVAAINTFGNSRTFYNVNVTGSAVFTTGSSLYSHTFRSLVVTGTASVEDYLAIDNIAVTTTLTITAPSPYRYLVQKRQMQGFNRVNIDFGGAAVTFTNVDLTNISFLFSPASTTLSSVGNCGNITSPVTITSTPVTRYAVGGAANLNWSDTALWSTSSGGAPGASSPLPQDTAIFNANSTSGVVTIDRPRVCASLTTSGWTGNFSIIYAPVFYGTVDNINKIPSGTIYFHSISGSSTLNLTAAAVKSYIIVGGTYTQNGDLTSANSGTSLSVYYGTFNTNGFSVSTGILQRIALNVASYYGFGSTAADATIAGAFNLSSSTVTLTGSTPLSIQNLSTFTAGTSNVVIQPSATSGLTTITPKAGAAFYNLTIKVNSNTSTTVYRTLALGSSSLSVSVSNILKNESLVPVIAYVTAPSNLTVNQLDIVSSTSAWFIFSKSSTFSPTATNVILNLTGGGQNTFAVGYFGISVNGATLTASGVADLGGNAGLITFPSTLKVYAFAGTGISSFQVPLNYGGSNMFIGIGGGGSASKASGRGSGGGGGGAFTLAYNLPVAGGQTVYFNAPASAPGATVVGTNGTGGGTTWVNITTNAQPTSIANGFTALPGGPSFASSASGGAAGGSTGVGLIKLSGNAGGASSATVNGVAGGGGGAPSYWTIDTSAGAGGNAGSQTQYGGGGGGSNTSGVSGATTGLGGNGSTGVPLLNGGGGNGGISGASPGAGLAPTSPYPLFTTDFFNGSPSVISIGAGGGGGGGGTSTVGTTVAGSGGDGLYGGGGGGGGDNTITSANVGNGGNGGEGLMIFVYATGTGGGASFGAILG